MSDSVRPQRRQPTRLPHPWDSPGKNNGVGCHCLLQCMKVKSESEVTQSCPTLPWHPMDCSLPGSSAHGIFQARVLEWGAIYTIQCICFQNGATETYFSAYSLVHGYSSIWNIKVEAQKLQETLFFAQKPICRGRWGGAFRSKMSKRERVTGAEELVQSCTPRLASLHLKWGVSSLRLWRQYFLLPRREWANCALNSSPYKEFSFSMWKELWFIHFPFYYLL